MGGGPLTTGLGCVKAWNAPRPAVGAAASMALVGASRDTASGSDTVTSSLEWQRLMGTISTPAAAAASATARVSMPPAASWAKTFCRSAAATGLDRKRSAPSASERRTLAWSHCELIMTNAGRGLLLVALSSSGAGPAAAAPSAGAPSAPAGRGAPSPAGDEWRYISSNLARSSSPVISGMLWSESTRSYCASSSSALRSAS
mmetsp:Transcript_11502/g.48251  ORF Transcript_11502/g.48251 Transcript_11502/m.48251 type:complete len:202 (-) Transcript_11502:236-841(-)